MRNTLINEFLVKAGLAPFERKMLAGDASFRKYERVFANGKSYVLMDAPPEKEDITPFITIATHLQQDYQLSTPQILAADEAHGLLLLEDLGDNLYARLLEQDNSQEAELYQTAMQVLVELYHQADKVKRQDLPVFTAEKMLAQVRLLTEWFLPYKSGGDVSQAITEHYLAIWKRIIVKLPALKPVLVLYDYHAENIIWLPEHEQAKRAGLLDFQDAMCGNSAYDVVSVLEDARRDVSADTVAKSLHYYLEHTGIEESNFQLGYAIMGAQRNCRIVGTFARLAVRDHKPRYLDFMPRIWRHIANDISHPALAELKDWLDEHVPEEWRT